MFKAYKKYWKQYADFEGRSTPADFWWVFLIKCLVGFVFFIVFWISIFWQSLDFMSTFEGNIDAMTDAENTQLGLRVIVGLLPLFIFICFWGLVNFIPSYALQVRRLRDAGLHWSFVLLNWSVLLIFVTAASPALFVASLFITLGCKVTLLVLLGQSSTSKSNQAVYQPYVAPTTRSYEQDPVEEIQTIGPASAITEPSHQHPAPTGQPQPQGYEQLLGGIAPQLDSSTQSADSDWQANSSTSSEFQEPAITPPLFGEGIGSYQGQLEETNQQPSPSQSLDSPVQDPRGESFNSPSNETRTDNSEDLGKASSADSAAL